MKFTSQISSFSSYLNGETPYVKNGNWWIGDTDTGVAAQAVDGVSFSGIVEYYFATLSTEVDADGTPNAPNWNKATWFTKIQDTKFGTKNNSGVTYKYLWNVEIVRSTSADGIVSESASDVELFLTHNDSRIPAEYISYYAASVTSVAPWGYPTLGANNNYISGPNNPIWKIADEYTGSTDESAFLFEVSFVKYTERDEKGYNLYALLSGPSMIGHNGANGPKGDNSVTYSLSVIPNSWNKSVYPTIYPSFVVTQHDGGETVEMQDGYIIKVGGTIWNNGSITEDTTFDLYVNDELVDSETVTAVSNGVNGTTPQKGVDYFDGSTGTETEAVRIFAYNTINSAPALTNSTPIGSTSIGISPGIWTTDEITADYTYKFVFTSTGVKTTTYSGTVAQPSTYSGWTTPELWGAYHANVGSKEYATFLKLTNNGAAKGLKYDNGQLYINATYINTGTLTVGSSSSPILSVTAGENGAVSIAGWTVTSLYGIYGNNYKVGMVDPIAGSASFSRTSLVSGSSKIVFYAGSFDPTGSGNYTKIPAFTVLADGSLYASAAQITGEITATSGKIGGTYFWALDSNGVYQNTTPGQFTGMMSNGRKIKDESGTYQGFVKFYAGGSVSMADTNQAAAKASTLANYVVTDQGYLYAKNAYIDGVIRAQSGTIAGFTIGTFNFSGGTARQSMYYGVTQNAATIAANQMVICPQGAYLGKFSTGTSEGNRFVMLIGTNFGITQSGKLYTTSAKIGNFELSDGYLNAAGGEYGVIRAARMDSALNGGSIVSIGAGQLKVGWVVKHIGTTTNQYSGDWMALSQDTLVWGGLCGGDIQTMTASSVSAALNTFANRTITSETIGWRFTGTSWLTYDVDCGRSIQIQSDWGTNNECSIKLGDLSDSGMSRGHVSIWANGTYLAMQGDDNQLSDRKLNSVYIGGSSQSISLYLNGTLLHSSWSKKKTNINCINEQYDTFFDNLVPKKYFYNIYPENAYHLGFIFEEVGESLARAGLQKEDFCGYSLTDPITGEGHLAYTEFIALNTWQIQKLKPRMTAAEQEIEKLKLEIAQLREELKNLQKS